MAECECFELTLLICERVWGLERGGHPLQHMGSRFTPLHLKTPPNPDGHWPVPLSFTRRDSVSLTQLLKAVGIKMLFLFKTSFFVREVRPTEKQGTLQV